MDIYHIVKRPLITEKGTHQSQQSQHLGKGGQPSQPVDRLV